MSEINPPYEYNEFDRLDQRPDSGDKDPDINFDFAPGPHYDENDNPAEDYMRVIGEIYTSPMTAPDSAQDAGELLPDAEIAWFDDDLYADIDERSQTNDGLPTEGITIYHIENETAFLGFREPFDGMQREVPPAEQKAAGAALSDFVAECLEGCANKTHEGFELHHRANDGSGNVIISIISDRSPDRDPQFTQEIVLTEISGSGTGERVSYHVGDDEIARRIDSAPASEDERQASEISYLSLEEYQALPPEGREIYDRINRERNEEQIRNVDMEEGFGLRNQPVGLDEVTRLIAYVRGLL